MSEVYPQLDSESLANTENLPPEIVIQKMKLENEKQIRNDRLMLALIFCVGVFGFSYVFFLQDYLSTKQVAFEDNYANIAATQVPAKQLISTSEKNHLSIIGNREANEKLKFVLDSFNDKVIYTLRFGNGNGTILKEKVTEYIYPAAGNFRVTLEARYKSKKKVIYDESVYIDEEITVANGAYNEYF